MTVVPLTSAGDAACPVAVPVIIKPSDENNSAASAVLERLTSAVIECELNEKINYLWLGNNEENMFPAREHTY